MHTVAPVVAADGGNVDALGVRVGETESAVDGEPVLEREDGEHRRGGEMVADNVMAEPWLAGIRSLAAEVQMIEPDGNLPILFPPCAQRVHVVG